MSEIRSIRRKTRELIAAQERERKAEIAKLRSEFAEKEKNLIEDSRRREEMYARKLIELEREQRQQIALGQEDLAQKTRKLAEDMSLRLTELQRSTQAEIERQKKDLEKKIEDVFNRIEEKIKKLYEMIDNKDQREEAYAEDCVERARERLSLLQASTAVQMFKDFAVHPLIAQFNRLISLSAQRLWLAMASAAVNVECHSESVQAEAEHLYAQWLAKREALSSQLSILRTKSEAAGGLESVFSLGAVSSYSACRRPWAQAAFSKAEERIDETKARLFSEPPCTMDEMIKIELELKEIDDQIESAVHEAEQQINIYLMIASAAFVIQEEMEAYGSGWNAPDGIVAVEIENTGDLTLVSGSDSLDIHMRGNPRNLKEILVTISFDGPAMQDVRKEQLRKICSHLALMLSEPENGALSMGNISFFKNGRLVCVSFPLSSAIDAFHIQETETDKTQEVEIANLSSGNTEEQSKKKM